MIATKGGIDPGAERSRDSGREFLRAGVESSLRAMKIDYIDLYQVHWPDPQTPFEDTAATCRSWSTRARSATSGSPTSTRSRWRRSSASGPSRPCSRPTTCSGGPWRSTIWPYVREHDIGVLVYSPLGSGLLTGTMTEDTTFDDGDWRSQASAFTGEAFETNLRVVEELKEFAAKKGCEVSQLAIAWVLAQPEVDVAIVGARSRRNIERSLAAVDIELTADDLAQIDHITMDGVEVAGRDPGGRGLSIAR